MIEHLFTVACEVPACVALGGRAKLTDPTAVNASHAIATARAKGWRHVNGRDICPSCWQIGWRYRGTQFHGEFYRRGQTSATA